MNSKAGIDPALLAWIYDQTMQNWPGEWDFYLDLAKKLSSQDEPILEIGCGTGRIAIRYAKLGYKVTGLDLSPSMLERARQNAPDPINPKWVCADMRHFHIDQEYGLAIIPATPFSSCSLQMRNWTV